ncbi:tRNA pseudouridine synthase A [Methanocaldococcus villosus KIN24-T80]|uniref:tRNA pseudouridine synthase A n=1 Tax=Methanocaldococcus villosus KIN24-T80 TaxID=1069083 RepID=N6V0M6_9EURY|nr:tRNA pseudouridine(38-40) synthase TruA [Methanocaldococcus villosus]ENN95868.1 tRNA pseudouridine synthase A [Methanocaldococcus villosus KIN24-T80]
MYILKIAYDGRYSFQQQPSKDTVCDKLLDVLDKLDFLKEYKIIYSGGRTDKGVSALGNFVVLKLKREPILSYINHHLKDYGIWILGYKEIEKIPKVRYRHYRYILPNIGYDISLIKEASKKFIGKHSFHNLCKRDRSKDRDPVREIYDIKIIENEFFITIDIIGKSFLWHMVRKIVGVFDAIGRGEKDIEWIDKLLDPNHKEGVRTFPAEGLILIEAKVDIDYNYDSYSIKKFLEYWQERYKFYIMKMGISRSFITTL